MYGINEVKGPIDFKILEFFRPINYLICCCSLLIKTNFFLPVGRDKIS